MYKKPPIPEEDELVQFPFRLLLPWQQKRVVEARAAQEKAFEDRWKVDYWKPGNPIYEQYAKK